MALVKSILENQTPQTLGVPTTDEFVDGLVVGNGSGLFIGTYLLKEVVGTACECGESVPAGFQSTPIPVGIVTRGRRQRWVP